MACRPLPGQTNLRSTRGSGQILLSGGADFPTAAARATEKICSRSQVALLHHTRSSQSGPPRPKITITGPTVVQARAGTTRKSSGAKQSCWDAVLREIEHAKFGCVITSHPETLLVNDRTKAERQYWISRTLAVAQRVCLPLGIGFAGRSY
jgi:hypothetical protein